MNNTSSRMVGALPLSIATSIALEHLFGITSEANPEPKPKSIQNYREFWINLKTLYRNLHGALDKESSKIVLPNELATTLREEMEMISSLVNEYSLGVTRVIYYVSNYEGLDKKFKSAQIRTDVTENQKAYSSLMRLTLDKLLKEVSNNDNLEVRLFLLKIRPTNNNTKTLILTHIAYDLVSHTNFGSLTLVESHTGAIKDRDKWYTKYYDGKELSMIPFIEALLPVFGDNEFFKPLSKQARMDILEIANKYHWSAVTTREKLLYGIDTIKNPYLKETVKSFFH